MPPAPSGSRSSMVSNSAPRIALKQSAYGEQKWETLRVVKDEIYAEQIVDPLEYHAGPSNVLTYSQVIVPQAGDYYIRKHVHSGFFDTRLDTLLRNLGVRNLVCVGIALDVCLGNTMIDALWRTIAFSCCATVPTQSSFRASTSRGPGRSAGSSTPSAPSAAPRRPEPGRMPATGRWRRRVGQQANPLETGRPERPKGHHDPRLPLLAS
jgi:hypothetical protein